MGTWRWDITTDRRTYDDRTCHLLGINPAQFKGLPEEFFSALHPDDRSRIKKALLEALEKRIPYESDFRVIGPDGAVRHIYSRGRPAYDDNDNPLSIGGIIWDATAQKQAEREREAILQQLHQARKMESIGTLAGGIAHDFNNLLGGILGTLSLIELELGKEFEFYQDIQEMKALIKRGANLNKQLLGFARRDRGDVRPLNLSDTLQKIAGMFGRTRKDITINFLCSPELPAVMADHMQIEQVLLNLLVNSGQAMPSGGY
ncbi:MAG: PAS domain-containing protein, partial [Desulfomonilaceae bacterium]|nr:PAS domain-containing protein [Desulfomonilaceae bacterium]